MPETTNFNIPFLDGTELVRDYPTFSEDLANAVDGAIPLNATPTVAGVVRGTTSDSFNTALGLDAFISNTTGNSVTALGRNALQNNTSGRESVAVGANSSNANTTGKFNVAVGERALENNTTSDNNTGVGRRALRNNTAPDNTAVGNAALNANTAGNSNTALGALSLLSNTTSDNTMGLGFSASSSSLTVNNEITLGNASITSLRCNVTTISSLSDARDKTDIVDTQHGLDTLNKMRPVDFTWARRDGTFGSAPDIGFIAQELASVEDETGDAQRLRLTLRNNPDKLEATPGRLIPILVKAVQELSAKNDELEARIEALEAK